MSSSLEQSLLRDLAQQSDVQSLIATLLSNAKAAELAAQQMKNQDITVEALFQEAWKEHWDKGKLKNSAWAKEAKRYYEKYIKPEFGDTKLSEVTPLKVKKWHRGYEEKPYAANRALEVFSRMFNFAEEYEFRKQGTNPCALVKAFVEKKRKRYASDEEIRKVGQILVRESLTNPSGVAYLYLLMFSGARPSSIERARWDQLQTVEIKIENVPQTFGILTLKGKMTNATGDEDVIVLPPPAMDVINRLPRTEKTIIGRGLPVKLWRKVRRIAGCPDLRIRDWRRTYATVGLSNGVEIGVIAELLNHKSTQTTKRYAKLQDGARLNAAALIAQNMGTLLKGDTSE